MLYGEKWYFVNFLMVCGAFSLFILLITIFGMIFLYFIRKFNKKEWGLNFSEIFIISFAIGLSIYLFICYILDLFMFFNFYSAYLSLIIIDVIFILYLIHHKDLTREKIANFFTSIKKKFANNSKESVIFVGIVIIILIIQILVQWRIMAQQLPLPSKDTYSIVGHMYHLIERGYFWRERHSIHYPRGFHFFITAPVLIYPDFYFVYMYMKFGGIPFMCFYILTMTIILKRIFKKNYLIFTGLMLTLTSNILLSRFSINVSSTIATIMVLVFFIILQSKAPFYLTGFLIQIMFLINPTIAFCYSLLWLFIVLLKLISEEYHFRIVLIDYLIKPLILIILLLLSYIIHTMIVKNITFIELLDSFFFFFKFSKVEFNLSKNSNFLILLFNIDFSDILKDLLPHNDFLSAFLDMEKRIISFFLIFTFVGLFLPTKKYFGTKFCELVKLTKFSLFVIICLYILELLFGNSTIMLFLFLIYIIKIKAVEAFVGSIIIFCCFNLKLIIEKAKYFTIYLKNKYSSYRNLLKNNRFSKFLKMENIIITILLISVCSTFFVHRDVDYNVHFEKEEIETIFYIKDKIPEDSKILVHWYGGTHDALYSLLSTYKIYDWEFSEGENNIIEIKEYIRDKNIEYVLLDLETVSSIELANFTNDLHFEYLYENEIHMFFEYHDSLSI